MSFFHDIIAAEEKFANLDDIAEENRDYDDNRSSNYQKSMGGS